MQNGNPPPGSLAESLLQGRSAKEAIEEALSTPLRQVVGSCFATAPAILIQREQPASMRRDLEELLATDQLSRTYGGVQYTVPLSPAPTLLRAWEYTLASMSEAKANLSRWNLHTTLGLHAEAHDGLAPLMMEEAQSLLDHLNADLENLHHRYLSAVQTAEEQPLLQQFRLAEEHTYRVAELPRQLAQAIDALLPTYWAEVYDPLLAEQREYEDSPAGFRLTYKHGRPSPALWTPITSADQFTQYLVEFFHLVEAQIHFEGPELSQILTRLILHIRSPEFMESSFRRVREKRPTATPWSYVSGGSMESLLSCYYERDPPFARQERQIESPTDLCLFLIETCKLLSAAEQQRFLDDPSRALLMESPGHAFSLLPGLFARAWLDRGNTYTWVRDHLLDPHERRLEEVMPYYREALSRGLSPDQAASSLFPYLEHPFLFADTNWVETYFAFASNPATGALDLWRCDPSGQSGIPMTIWRPFLDGSSPRTWLVYTDPTQYR